MKNKKTFKIIAGIVILLIGIILFITNVLVGNPISAKIADIAIQKYVDNEYPLLDLEIEKSSYNFKNESYIGKAKSKSSIDTHFYIYHRDGKVYRDDYADSVLNMSNTVNRLSKEYSIIAKSLITNNLGFGVKSIRVFYDKSEYEHPDKNLKLDMKFDKSLPLDAEVGISLDLTDISIKNIAKVLTDIHKVFSDNGCNFSKYKLNAENNDKGILVMVSNVTPSNIESGELANLIKRAKNNESVNGIIVYIKGEKK